VDEATWWACDDPVKMLKCLRGKASDRKLRLFACACCRAAQPLLSIDPLRRGVETAERYADKDATWSDMVGYAKAAERQGWSMSGKERTLADAAWATTAMNLWYYFRAVTRTVDTVQYLLSYDGGQAHHQVALLRDIAGNPFRPLLPLASSLLAWRDGFIVQLAEGVYENRILPRGHFDKDRVAVLADALEEAGCTEAELLGHLRGPGPHVRGCWAMDTILAKE
jgi:hypothetical protein